MNDAMPVMDRRFDHCVYIVRENLGDLRGADRQVPRIDNAPATQAMFGAIVAPI